MYVYVKLKKMTHMKHMLQKETTIHFQFNFTDGVRRVGFIKPHAHKIRLYLSTVARELKLAAIHAIILFWGLPQVLKP